MYHLIPDQVDLCDDDEFFVVACDGIWYVHHFLISLDFFFFFFAIDTLLIELILYLTWYIIEVWR